jgi:D-3-phosphoglycerate dehydrogenase
MRLLAIGDTYIPASFMRQGLAPLHELGVDVHVRQWEHDTLIDLQRDNLAIETDGPDAVPLPADLTRECADFDFLVVQFTPVSRAFLRAARSLKVIGVLRGGTENVDVPFATKHDICVLNTPGRNARAVAECTVGMILTEVRNLARSYACLKRGEWRREFPNSNTIPELNEKTVGLVGFGAVGQLVAHYLHAFGCRLLVYDPFAPDDPSPARLVDLPCLLRESDVVSLHARLTVENQHMIGAAELALMKQTAVLINTARSGLVDEAALINALANRTIQGAAVDVFDHEPLVPDHPFIQLDNITITPHLAGSTIDAFRNSPRMMCQHLTRLLRRQGDLPITNGVQPRLGARR